MGLKLKIAFASVLWTAAVACAIAFSVWRSDPLLMWGVVTTAAAASVSAMVAGDYIGWAAAKHIIDRVTSERNATVDRAARQMQEADKRREDRTVSRIQASNEAALRRMALELVRAMREEAATPRSPFGRN